MNLLLFFWLSIAAATATAHCPLPTAYCLLSLRTTPSALRIWAWLRIPGSMQFLLFKRRWKHAWVKRIR
ncbi:MAG: hypothetical protein WC865_11055 [Bacteroidales bacterium]